MKWKLIFCLVFWMSYDDSLAVTVEFARPLKNMTVTKGHNVLLRCSVTSNGNAVERSWTYDSHIMYANSKKWTKDPRMKLISDTEFEYTMEVENVGLKDEGFYTCTIYADKTKSSSLYLTVNTQPAFTDVTGNLVVDEGVSVILKCIAEAKPQPKITWRHLLPSADSVRATSEYLPLGNVQRDSGGRYECTADNGVSFPIHHFITLTVNYPPEIDEETDRSVIKESLHKSISIECVALAVPPPKFTWFHPTGAKINKFNSGSQYGFVNTNQHNSFYSKLIIPNLQLSDFGNYTCMTSNKLGQANKSFLLIQKVLPPTRPPPYAVFDRLTSDIEDGGRGGCRSVKFTLHAYIISFNVIMLIVISTF